MKHSNIQQSQISKSLYFSNHSLESDENTQYRVNLLGFHHLPCSKSKQWSDMVDSITIDYMQSNSQKQREVFKCFKCYGIIQNKQLASIRSCRQCLGTSFVTGSNGLVKIFEQIVSQEFPQFSNKEHNTNTNKQILNKIYTIQKQYACPETIKEESFSMQEDQTLLCRRCSKQCEKNYYKCDTCANYYICSYCYQSHLDYHEHRLYPKELFIKIGDLNPRYTLKTISEQAEFFQASKNNLSRCKNCFRKVQISYLVCITCNKKGIHFILCNKCYVNKLYDHQQNHRFTFKDVSSEQQEQKVDLSSYKESYFDFKNIPMFRSLDSFSDKIKEVGFQKNSSINIQEQTPNNRSVVMIRADISQKSFLQSQVQQVAQLPQLKSKLSRSYHSYKEQQEDFSIRFSQNRHEIDLQNNLQFHQIHEESGIEYASLNYQRPKKYNFLSKNSYRKNKAKVDRSNPSNPEEYVFYNYYCDICGVMPIINRKYHCDSCENFDLCEKCYNNYSSKHQHQNFHMEDGSELKKQRQFLAKSIQQKSVQASNSLYYISKRMAYNIQTTKSVG